MYSIAAHSWQTESTLNTPRPLPLVADGASASLYLIPACNSRMPLYWRNPFANSLLAKLTLTCTAFLCPTVPKMSLANRFRSVLLHQISSYVVLIIALSPMLLLFWMLLVFLWTSSKVYHIPNPMGTPSMTCSLLQLIFSCDSLASALQFVLLNTGRTLIMFRTLSPLLAMSLLCMETRSPPLLVCNPWNLL